MGAKLINGNSEATTQSGTRCLKDKDCDLLVLMRRSTRAVTLSFFVFYVGQGEPDSADSLVSLYVNNQRDVVNGKDLDYPYTVAAVQVKRGLTNDIDTTSDKRLSYSIYARDGQTKPVKIPGSLNTVFHERQTIVQCCDSGSSDNRLFNFHMLESQEGKGISYGNTYRIEWELLLYVKVTQRIRHFAKQQDGFVNILSTEVRNLITMDTPIKIFDGSNNPIVTTSSTTTTSNPTSVKSPTEPSKAKSNRSLIFYVIAGIVVVALIIGGAVILIGRKRSSKHGQRDLEPSESAAGVSNTEDGDTATTTASEIKDKARPASRKNKPADMASTTAKQTQDEDNLSNFFKN